MITLSLMNTLGDYLRDELHRRDLSPEEFGRRAGLGTSHVYQIIRGQKRNVRKVTLERIAAGLGMTASELMAALNVPPDTDPFDLTVGSTKAQMMEVLRDVPRPFWAPIIQKTFDRAIDSARDMAHLLAESDSRLHTVSSARNADASNSDSSTNKGPQDSPGQIKARYVLAAA